MKKPNKKVVFHTTEVVFLIVVTCIVSLTMGYFASINMDTSLKVDSSYDEHVKEFLDNYEYIMENYYDKIDSETLMAGALDGMIASLGDDYSTVIDSTSFDAQLEGNYEGVGIEIYSTDAQIIIISVFEGSSAAKAGLKPGDIILSVDGVEYSGKESSAITEYISSSKASSFEFKILRGEEEHTFTLNRAHVTIPSVESELFEKENKKIGYIYIDIFANATVEQFSDALSRLEKQNIDGLIIDVRSNSGGHLTTVVDVLSNFLDSKKVIYQTETKGTIKKFYSKGKETKNYPIVVLQNSSSASASELLSIALKEQYGATIIGEVSYGKGTVQELVSSGDVEYKFTTKKWLSPNGVWIHEKGVTPDIAVSLDTNYYNDPTYDNDNQLQCAISELLK